MSILLRTFSGKPTAALSLLALLALGCSRSMTPAAVPGASATTAAAATPEIVPARNAFWLMYKSAHDWAPDVVAIRITQKELRGFKNDAGKAGLWEAVFASPSRHEYRIYTYAIASVPPGTYKGVGASHSMPWYGATREAMPIDLNLFNTDSDTAYEAAAANAAEWHRKNPTRELTALALGQTSKYSGPVWYVLWGTKASGYTAFVDATTGKVMPHK